jgi:hypothetical protein
VFGVCIACCRRLPMGVERFTYLLLLHWLLLVRVEFAILYL